MARGALVTEMMSPLYVPLALSREHRDDGATPVGVVVGGGTVVVVGGGAVVCGNPAHSYVLNP